MEEKEVSIILPCLNEEEAIGICIRKIKEVFARDNINGEIIVVDNGSTDNSAEIAQKEGAKVVKEPRRGYGSAYLRGLKEVKANFIIMVDGDNTYDLYEIPRFLEPLKKGYDFVIGSRFRGKIHKGAMPFLNRYLGNPLLSTMTRIFFRTKLSDIHCGMRAFTYEAYKKMKLKTLGMEFATEMVVSALQNNLKICEIPINYYPRIGKSKLKPFIDAWRHIRFMLLYCPSWLYFVPGMTGFLIGLIILILLFKAPFVFLGHAWDLHAMVFGAILTILSYQILNLGVFAHSYAIKEGLLKPDKLSLFLMRHFNLEKGIIIGGIAFLFGFLINLFIFIEWFSKDFGPLYRIREAILGMSLLVIGLQTIFSSFFISLLFLEKGS